ncbi:N-formylglutamate amidohydrolase [Nitratireductor sp. CAU 1489]|uniref:N-formylglutamate amidohydrolase n=1 Tax=Nitratireductor arenosus TaxID=2682096 RepID=A0A844QDE8_9HYPH|nr:N-formylglutamate amidohydrolase [Nitratireductor arenosus]MVA95859.1 N-formylglutamate amidohydrolase [Nitratireductor arenosus]
MGAAPSQSAETFDPVRLSGRSAPGPLVLLCEHASNFVPAELADLGLPVAALQSHIAWDPGAAAVARAMAGRLGAALVESTVSRLVADCNRLPDAADLAPEISETTSVPGNRGLDARGRARRIAMAHAPFHAAVAGLIEERIAANRPAAVVSVHSYTPVYRGRHRPWHVGIVHDADARMARPMLAGLARLPGIVVGDNQPYSPQDGVYYSLARHARARSLPCAMIEIRNDGIATDEGQRLWAGRLCDILATMGYAAQEGA